MRDILELRRIVRTDWSASRLETDELVAVAEQAREPHVPSGSLWSRDWAEREAVPLLRELAARLKARRRRCQRDEILRDWLENEFREACLDDERIMQALAMLVVGRQEYGDSAAEAIRRAIAAFVVELIEPGALDREAAARREN